jgi:hypothetical protein
MTSSRWWRHSIFSPLTPSGHFTYHMISIVKYYIVLTKRVLGFRIDTRINKDYFTTLYKMIIFIIDKELLTWNTLNIYVKLRLIFALFMVKVLINISVIFEFSSSRGVRKSTILPDILCPPRFLSYLMPTKVPLIFLP